jgi:hypothetical protein
MKKYAIIMAMLTVIGISVSSCSASARIGTKNHEVGASTHVQ